MIYAIVNCRQIFKGGSCDHGRHLLCVEYSGLMHDFPGLKYVSSLMRCPSTIVTTPYQSFIHVT